MQLSFIWTICFFYKQHFYKQHKAQIKQKIKQKLSKTLRLNVSYLKIIYFFIKSLSKSNWAYSNVQTSNCACFNNIISLILRKMQKLHMCEIHRLWPKHWHKYAKYVMCPSIMTLICIKQRLSNICSSISNTLAELNKS